MEFDSKYGSQRLGASRALVQWKCQPFLWQRTLHGNLIGNFCIDQMRNLFSSFFLVCSWKPVTLHKWYGVIAASWALEWPKIALDKYLWLQITIRPAISSAASARMFHRSVVSMMTKWRNPNDRPFHSNRSWIQSKRMTWIWKYLSRPFCGITTISGANMAFLNSSESNGWFWTLRQFCWLKSRLSISMALSEVPSSSVNTNTYLFEQLLCFSTNFFAF